MKKFKSNNLKYATATLALTICGAMASDALAEDWVTGSYGDFEVKMPVRATTMTNGMTGTRIYRCATRTNNFIVSVSNPGVQKDSYKRFLDGIEQGLKTRGGKIVAATPSKGTGWSGTLIQAEFSDNAKNTTLVAMASGVPVIYTLGVNLPMMDTDSQKFIHSLVVYPSQAALLPVKRPKREQAQTEEAGSTYEVELNADGTLPGSGSGGQGRNDGDGPDTYRRKGKGFLDATSISIFMPTVVIFVLLMMSISRFIANKRRGKK